MRLLLTRVIRIGAEILEPSGTSCEGQCLFILDHIPKSTRHSQRTLPLRCALSCSATVCDDDRRSGLKMPFRKCDKQRVSRQYESECVFPGGPCYLCGTNSTCTCIDVQSTWCCTSRNCCLQSSLSELSRQLECEVPLPHLVLYESPVRDMQVHIPR